MLNFSSDRSQDEDFRHFEGVGSVTFQRNTRNFFIYVRGALSFDL